MKTSSERHRLPGNTQLVDLSTYVTALLFLFLFFRAAGFQFVGHLVVTLAFLKQRYLPPTMPDIKLKNQAGLCAPNLTFSLYQHQALRRCFPSQRTRRLLLPSYRTSLRLEL